MDSKQDRATIMVVDDTPANLMLLDDMLSAKGYRVLTMPRGDLALKAVTINPPDLILLDINMPGMNGFEVCKRLKEDENMNDTPVLFISAYTETVEKIKAFSAGGVDYITKPFQEEEVTARVETHLEIHRQKREIAKNYRELKELIGLRDNLTQMIVHDLRSPLTAIYGSLEVLNLTFNDELSEQANQLIRNARNNASKMIEMVSSLLDLDRLESGELQLNIEEVDVNMMIEDSLAMFKDSAKHIHFDVKVSSKSLKSSFDKELIRRVLINLTENAVKFSPDRSVITISASETEKELKFSVTDKGPGIPLESHEFIFKKYGQLASKRFGYSSGIGLAFCKLAVEAHHGTIGVESEVGSGSTFMFTLPKS